jgi:hypothetical protein
MEVEVGDVVPTPLVHRIGNVYTHHGQEYMLATPSCMEVSLINMSLGTRWRSSVCVNRLTNLTEEEWKMVTGGHVFDFVRNERVTVHEPPVEPRIKLTLTGIDEIELMYAILNSGHIQSYQNGRLGTTPKHTCFTHGDFCAYCDVCKSMNLFDDDGYFKRD